jgi:hypothetical protein
MKELTALWIGDMKLLVAKRIQRFSFQSAIPGLHLLKSKMRKKYVIDVQLKSHALLGPLRVVKMLVFGVVFLRMSAEQ